jgi:hypothetical protein
VERFSNLKNRGTRHHRHPVGLELIAGATSAVNPAATALLDIGAALGITP